MIKIIANKRIDLSIPEYEYYLELEKTFSKDIFFDLFETNKEGQVTFVKPSIENPTSFLVMFYILNVMYNQRLRKLEPWIDKVNSFEERISKLENAGGKNE